MPNEPTERYFYILNLNDMRMGSIEDVIPICWAYSQKELQALMDAERVKPYQDGQWRKNFRKGGPLEWCNVPMLANPIQRFQDPRGALPTAAAMLQVGRRARGQLGQ